ncbi:unnamed protein product [Closterium sp. Naga37s-1]|nr:unnamed protein product [Closterium sp. Naga37s-1]
MFKNASTLMLKLSYNKLQGGLDEFMALIGLCSLTLTGNHLSGKIPAKDKRPLVGAAASASADRAVRERARGGKLPNIIKCPKELLVANNGFTANLPNVDSCAGVEERVDLSYNQLSGAIPTIVAEFSFLTHLSL